MLIKYSFLFIFLFVCACTDLLTNRIKNNLIITALLIGIAFFSSKEAFIGLAVPFFTLFPVYRLGLCGAGGGKLLMLLGFYLGLNLLLSCMPAILILSVLFIAAVSIAEKKNVTQAEIPFAVPVFLGVIPTILNIRFI